MIMKATGSPFQAGQPTPAKCTCERADSSASARNKRRRRCKNLAQGGGLAEPWVLVVKKAHSSEGAKEPVERRAIKAAQYSRMTTMTS